jgi:hypothetical protein
MKTKLERFLYAREVLGWVATIDGDVINKHGRKIGRISKKGYWISGITIQGKMYSIKLHQYVYWFWYNDTPKVLDHIDRNKANNAPANLRESTTQENAWNNSAKGYSFYKRTGKWMSYIVVDYRSIHLGYYFNEQDARNAYLNAKKIYHTKK